MADYSDHEWEAKKLTLAAERAKDKASQRKYTTFADVIAYLRENPKAVDTLREILATESTTE